MSLYLKRTLETTKHFPQSFTHRNQPRAQVQQTCVHQTMTTSTHSHTFSPFSSGLRERKGNTMKQLQAMFIIVRKQPSNPTCPILTRFGYDATTKTA